MMERDKLIEQLSAEPRSPFAASPTITMLLAVATACVVVALAASGWLGFRADLDSALLIFDHDFLLIVTFLVSVGCAALTIVRDASIPGRSPTLPRAIIFSPFILITVLALHEHCLGSPHHPTEGHAHKHWFTCVWQTLVLASAAFGILLLGIRRLAPTDLRRAGFYAGLLAGSIGAMGFCLHTVKDTAWFGATVYVLAIALMAAVGAWLGPCLLRWR
jgi:hypothetical protein